MCREFQSNSGKASSGGGPSGWIATRRPCSLTLSAPTPDGFERGSRPCEQARQCRRGYVANPKAPGLVRSVGATWVGAGGRPQSP